MCKVKSLPNTLKYLESSTFATNVLSTQTAENAPSIQEGNEQSRIMALVTYGNPVGLRQSEQALILALEQFILNLKKDSAVEGVATMPSPSLNVTRLAETSRFSGAATGGRPIKGAPDLLLQS
jgi:hypothetical protein